MLYNMQKFDIVSCQFAIHYAFESERTARTMIQNVAYSLREGGSFVVTVPDHEHLAKCKRVLGKRFGDQFHQVHIDTSTLDEVGQFQDYGSAYAFSFSGAVEKITEYVVKSDVLIGLCADCGMELLESRNFAEYEHERPSLATRMNAKFHPVSRFYRTFHFRMGDWRAET
jgi:mRNA (guanine-N7-)-methyltransferase